MFFDDESAERRVASTDFEATADMSPKVVVLDPEVLGLPP